jgi:hypothetical protein
MEFKIGSRVRIREFDDIDESIRHKGLGKHAGKEGEIVDVLYSDANECYVYRIQFDGCRRESTTDFLCGMFDIIEDEVIETYTHEIEYLDNVVVVRFFKVTDNYKQELARGHGHIIHDGAIGIAQATSYAMKRIYERMNGGTF